MDCSFLPLKIIHIKHFIFLLVIVWSGITHFIDTHTGNSSVSRHWEPLLKFVKVRQHVILTLRNPGQFDVSASKGDSFKD